MFGQNQIKHANTLFLNFQNDALQLFPWQRIESAFWDSADLESLTGLIIASLPLLLCIVIIYVYRRYDVSFWTGRKVVKIRGNEKMILGVLNNRLEVYVNHVDSMDALYRSLRRENRRLKEREIRYRVGEVSISTPAISHERIQVLWCSFLPYHN